MVQKKNRTKAAKNGFYALAAAVGMIAAVCGTSFTSLAEETVKVKVDSAVVRESADTNSAAVAGATSGATLSVQGDTTDASGNVWYQVTVDGKTGYIRSDLVEKQSGEQQSDQSSQSAQDGQTAQSSGASGASVDPESAMDAQYASITTAVAKVRTAPSTNESIVDKLNNGTQVVVSGQTNAADGYIWYYVTFTGTDGAEKTGYIRSDLMSLGDMVPVPEETETDESQTEETEEPETVVNNDYELTYEQNEDGVYTWYVYDYTGDGTTVERYQLQQLMAVTKARSEEDAKASKTVVKQRIAIIVLIVLLVALTAAVVFMALRLRDVYYGEDEEEETPSQRRRREEQEQENSVRRRRSESEEPDARRRQRAEQDGQARRRREGEDDTAQKRRRPAEQADAPARRRRSEEEERPVRRRPPEEGASAGAREARRREDDAGSDAAKTAQKRKTKNFLVDDDEFEFEFLNMDDKDK